MKNLRQIIQEFCIRTGVPVPSNVATSTDTRLRQLVGLLNEGLDDLTTREQLSAVHRITSFVTEGGGDQGELGVDLATEGYESLIRNTLWDETTQTFIPGSLSPQEWEYIQVGLTPTPYGQYRIIGNHLHLTPGFSADHTIRFEYESNWYLQNGAQGKQYYTADDDIFILPERIAISWLRYAWKREKGVDYAEEFAAYERHVATMAIRQAPAQAIDASCIRAPKYGIIVPQSGAGSGSGDGSGGGGGTIVVGEGGVVLGAN